MVLWQKQVGGALCKVKIDFYSQDTAWVEFEQLVGYVSEFDQIRFFGLYLAKTLYHFNLNSEVTALISYMYGFLNLMVKETNDPENMPRLNILEQNQSLAKLDKHPFRTYRAQFYGLNGLDREIDTCYPTGQELVFAPLSVIFFLQHLIFHLSNNGLYTLLVYLSQLIHYFIFTGDYTRLNSSRDSDLYALNSLISSLENQGNLM